MPDGTSLAEIKISELPVAPSVNDADQLEANQAGTSRSITVGQVKAAAVAAVPVPPTTLPPSGPAGGDLAGNYPNPTLVSNVKSFGVVGNGVTNDAAAIQAAIDYANGLGGGDLYFPPGTYAVATTIILKSKVNLSGADGTTIVWTGGASAVFTSPTTGILDQCRVEHLNITMAGATQAIALFSPYKCLFNNIRITSTSTTNTVMIVTTNTSGATGPYGNWNASYNWIGNITHDGTCGTFLQLAGIGVGTTPTGIVTLNTFASLGAQNCNIRGIEFVRWADTNVFSGMIRIGITGNNSVGVEFNTDAVANRGVYSNVFDHLAVDSFGVFTGRIGLKMNYTKQNEIRFFQNGPEAEGGAFVIDETNTQSLLVRHQKTGTNSIYVYRKLVYDKGSQEILTQSIPFEVSQTWNNAAVTFAGLKVTATDTASASGSALAQFATAVATQFNFLKTGSSLQTGALDIGYGATTQTWSLGIGRTRTGDGICTIDMVGDTTNTGGGLRLVRNAGVNASSQIVHRGTNTLLIHASDVGSVSIAVNAVNKIVANGTGVGFFNATPVAKPAVTGVLSAVTDANAKAVLTSVITALANLGLATNSTT